jgi:hypothetical protein
VGESFGIVRKGYAVVCVEESCGIVNRVCAVCCVKCGGRDFGILKTVCAVCFVICDIFGRVGGIVKTVFAV